MPRIKKGEKRNFTQSNKNNTSNYKSSDSISKRRRLNPAKSNDNESDDESGNESPMQFLEKASRTKLPLVPTNKRTKQQKKKVTVRNRPVIENSDSDSENESPKTTPTSYRVVVTGPDGVSGTERTKMKANFSENDKNKLKPHHRKSKTKNRRSSTSNYLTVKQSIAQNQSNNSSSPNSSNERRAKRKEKRQKYKLEQIQKEHDEDIKFCRTLILMLVAVITMLMVYVIYDLVKFHDQDHIFNIFSADIKHINDTKILRIDCPSCEECIQCEDCQVFKDTIKQCRSHLRDKDNDESDFEKCRIDFSKSKNDLVNCNLEIDKKEQTIERIKKNLQQSEKKNVELLKKINQEQD